MTEQNWAENQRRYDAGEYTLAECARHGWTHAGYEWARTAPGHFTPEQQDAYYRGYDKGKRGEYVSSNDERWRA